MKSPHLICLPLLIGNEQDIMLLYYMCTYCISLREGLYVILGVI